MLAWILNVISRLNKRSNMGPIGFAFGAAKKVYKGGKYVSGLLDESEEEKKES